MNEWISVKDRLPEIAGDYLVYKSGDEVNYFQDVMWFQVISGFASNYYISHWMSLPEAPHGSS
jgi:hypothetical protein